VIMQWQAPLLLAKAGLTLRVWFWQQPPLGLHVSVSVCMLGLVEHALQQACQAGLWWGTPPESSF
jgi:hypothetical protein